MATDNTRIVRRLVDEVVNGGKLDVIDELVMDDYVYIDNALGSFFSGQLPSFRQGLATFQSAYAARYGADKPFSAAPEAQQVAWLHEAEKSPFFAAVRRLTVLGLIALPKYGGNSDYKGWNLLGVEDNHAWAPPFGYYDVDYPGFEPYPGTKPYSA